MSITVGQPLLRVTGHGPYIGPIGVVTSLCLYELARVDGLYPRGLVDPTKLTDLSL